MFTKNLGHLDSIVKERDERQAQFDANRFFRFWLERGQEKRVIFLTDQTGTEEKDWVFPNLVPVIDEHNLKLNSKWGNHFRCLKDKGEACPLCEANDKPYTIGFYAIIDRSEFKSKKTDRVYKDTVKVLGVKVDTLKLLKKLSNKYGGLVGIEFEVSRSDGKQSANTGDNFIKEEKHGTTDVLSIVNAGRKEPAKSIKDIIPDWATYLAFEDKNVLAGLAGGKQSGKFDATESADFAD